MKIIMLYVVAVLLSLYRAYIVSCVWLWYMVAGLKLPVINTFIFLGILTIISLVAQPYIKLEEPDDKALKKGWQQVLVSFIFCTFTLFGAWVFKRFVN